MAKVGDAVKELIPLSKLDSSINTVEKLWEFCNENIKTALDEITKLEMYETDNPSTLTLEEKAALLEKAKSIQSVIDSSKVNKMFQSGYSVDISPTAFYEFFLAGITPAKLNIKNMRDKYEKIYASTQCQYAARQCTPPAHWDICYICGSGKETSQSFECEHILPAFTSIGHYGLIECAITLTKEDIEWYTYEYSYAHQCCNQVKSDDKWIEYNSNTKLYEINETSLKNTLQKIWKSQTKISQALGKVIHDCGELVPVFKGFKNIKNFVNQRSTYIINTYLTTLVRKINNTKNQQGELYHVFAHSRQLNALQLSFIDIARGLLNLKIDAKSKSALMEQTYDDNNVIQKIYTDTLSNDMGTYFTGILLQSLPLNTSGAIETIKKILHTDLRISERYPDATIKQHAEDMNRPVGIMLKKLRNELIEESMSKRTKAITETELIFELQNLANQAKSKIETYVLAELQKIDPDRICDIQQAPSPTRGRSPTRGKTTTRGRSPSRKKTGKRKNGSPRRRSLTRNQND